MHSNLQSDYQRAHQEKSSGKSLRTGSSSGDGRQEQFQELNLDQLLCLASRYHLGGLRLSDSAAVHLIRTLKNKAWEELEEGDGKRLETVRVEKQLGGRIVLFFGL